MTGDNAENPTLKRRVHHGLRWSFANTIGARLMTFTSGVILARLLLPDDFGAYAAALAIVNVLFGWNDLGMLLALVRWKGDVKHAARTAMTLSLLPSVGIYLLCFAVAPAFAELVNSPRSTGILRLIALTVVIDGAVAVPQGLLVRDFNQKRMAFIEFTAVPVNVLTTVILAHLGLGPWALAFGHVTGNIVSGILLTAFAPFRVRPGFDRTVARAMLSFGIPLAFTSMVEYMLLNADYVIVGSILGPVALGFYVIAYNVSSWPVQLLSETIRRVAIAGFAELTNENRHPAARFNGAFSLVLLVTLPMVVVFGVLGPDVIRFVYGTKWSPSGDALRFLALLAGARISLGFIFDLLVGAGRSRTTLALQTFWIVTLVPALAIGAHLGGIRGVGIAHAVVAVVVVAPLFVRAIGRFGVDLVDLAHRLARPVAGAALALATGLLVLPEVHHTLARLVLAGPAMMIAYGAVAVPRDLLAQVLVNLRSRRAPPPGMSIGPDGTDLDLGPAASGVA